MSYRPHPTKNKGLDIPKDWRGNIRGKIWWQVEVWPGGRKRENGKVTGKPFRPVRFDTESGIARYHDDLVAGIHGTQQLASNPRVIDSLPDFLAWYRTEASADTVADFEAAAKHFLPVFGPLKYSQLSSGIVQGYKLQRLEEKYLPGRPKQLLAKDTPEQAAKRRPYTKRTINRELSYLSTMVRWASEEQDPPLIEPGSVRIKLFRKEQTKRANPIITHTIDECARLIAAIGDETRYTRKHHKRMARDRYGLALLMYHAGLRKKEALHIEDERVNLPDEPLTMPDNSTYFGTITVIRKGNRVQTLPILTRMLYDELKTRKEESRKRDEEGRRYLYPSPLTGRPYLDIREGIKSAGVAAQVLKKNNPHLFRHDYVTHLHETGADIKSISELAGHSVLATTSEIYSHLTTNTLANRAKGFTERLESVVTRSQQKTRIK